jgi:hypothetical protein
VPDVIPALGWREERERFGDQRIDVIEGAWLCGTQERFQFREGLFDGIEIGAVGR